MKQCTISRGIKYLRCHLENEVFHWSQVIKDDPVNHEAYYERGAAYGGLKKYTRAISDFAKAIRLKPDYARACFGRAVAYYEKGDYKKSWEDLQKTEIIISNKKVFKTKTIKTI